MKKLLLAIALICVFSVQGFAAAGDKGDIIVTVTTFRNDDGGLYAILYNAVDAFPTKTDKAVKIVSSTVKNKKAQVMFNEIPYGEYAIAILHDENANRTMDYNFVGMPREGYGFSNDAKGMLRPPAYKDAKFTLDKPRLNATIKLNYCKFSKLGARK
jgi:uncharacterized protein (DUF2141 family)